MVPLCLHPNSMFNGPAQFRTTITRISCQTHWLPTHPRLGRMPLINHIAQRQMKGDQQERQNCLLMTIIESSLHKQYLSNVPAHPLVNNNRVSFSFTANSPPLYAKDIIIWLENIYSIIQIRPPVLILFALRFCLAGIYSALPPSRLYSASCDNNVGAIQFDPTFASQQISFPNQSVSFQSINWRRRVHRSPNCRKKIYDQQNVWLHFCVIWELSAIARWRDTFMAHCKLVTELFVFING